MQGLGQRREGRELGGREVPMGDGDGLAGAGDPLHVDADGFVSGDHDAEHAAGVGEVEMQPRVAEGEGPPPRVDPEAPRARIDRVVSAQNAAHEGPGAEVLPAHRGQGEGGEARAFGVVEEGEAAGRFVGVGRSGRGQEPQVRGVVVEADRPRRGAFGMVRRLPWRGAGCRVFLGRGLITAK